MNNDIDRLVAFVFGIIFIWLMWCWVDATEIDYESLKRLTPRGEFSGGDIPEVQQCYFYYKPYWKDITINIWWML